MLHSLQPTRRFLPPDFHSLPSSQIPAFSLVLLSIIRFQLNYCHSHYFYLMSTRYKDDTFHMLETFNNTTKRNTGFGLAQESKTETLRGKNGNTWDAKHMSNFINQSHYSNWSGANSASSSTHYPKHNRYNSSHDHFFKTTKDNKNVSKFGYSKVNPLVSLPQTNAHNSQVIKDYLRMQSPPRYAEPKPPMRQDGKFLYEGQSVKFRVTDPLTLQHIEQKQPSEFEKQRLKWLIRRRHPHGMTGIEHSESPTKQFNFESGLENTRIREEPNSHRMHVIDRDWKSKGRVKESYKDEYGFPKGNFIQERKFRNDDVHGYNIITNCQTHR